MTVVAPIIYRMSKAGECVRALVAGQLEHPEVRTEDHKALLERTAGEGALHEGSVKDKLREEGVRVINEQMELTIPILPGVLLVGHIDGMVEIGDPYPSELLEVKSKSTRQFERWVREGFSGFPDHAAQITCYMAALPDHPVRYMVKRREDGFVDITLIPANQPPMLFKDIRKKILVAESYRRRGEYPPCDIPRNNQWWCAFKYLHDEEESPPPGATVEEQEALVELAQWYLHLKAIEDDGKDAEKERKEKVNQSILNLLGDRDRVMVEISGENYIVGKSKASGKGIDLAKLRSMYPEIASEMETPWETPYPTVRRAKK